MLGYSKEDISILNNAIEYIKKHKTKAEEENIMDVQDNTEKLTVMYDKNEIKEYLENQIALPIEAKSALRLLSFLPISYIVLGSADKTIKLCINTGVKEKELYMCSVSILDGKVVVRKL
jgi:uncharacterized protein (UPF0210 family)